MESGSRVTTEDRKASNLLQFILSGRAHVLTVIRSEDHRPGSLEPSISFLTELSPLRRVLPSGLLI